MMMKPGLPAIQVYECRGGPETCQRPPGERCVTASGNPCPPHIGRWRLGEGYADAWNARQPEVDDLTARLLATTTERDTARLGAALVPGLQDEIRRVTTMAEQRIGLLRLDVEDRDATIRDLEARIAELTKPAAGKKVLGHYFPPYPISLDNEPPAEDYYTRGYLNPNAVGLESKWNAVGGLLRDRPLPRPPIDEGDWLLADMRTEVRNAKAAGLDGFVVNVMGTSGSNWTRIIALSRAAKLEGAFTVTPMVDANGGIGSQTPAAVAAKVAEIYAAGSGWVLDGGLALSSFKADGKPVSWWAQVITGLEAEVGPVRFIAALLNASDANMAAFAPISYGLGNWGNRHPRNVRSHRNYAEAARKLGCKWMAPVAPQDARPKSSVYAEAENTETFREMWRRAREDGADYVQVTTWNDYSESSQIAPSVGNGGTWLPLVSYYADWFRAGVQPVITKDRVILTHRAHPFAAKTTSGIMNMKPTLDGTSTPRDTIEALVFAVAPAQVSINDAPAVTVPAGITPVTAPLRPGQPCAEVLRGGQVVASVTSPHVVTNTPNVQDMAYRAATS